MFEFSAFTAASQRITEQSVLDCVRREGERGRREPNCTKTGLDARTSKLLALMNFSAESNGEPAQWELLYLSLQYNVQCTLYTEHCASSTVHRSEQSRPLFLI